MYQSFWNFSEKNWEIAWHLQKIVRHYESTVKMAFFISSLCLAVLATILKMSVLGICRAHCVLQISACSLGTNLWKKMMASNAIDMELENTVFLIAPVQFSVVRIVILFNIQFLNTVQNTSYFVMYMFFFY